MQQVLMMNKINSELINGILLVNKPQGLTSNRLLQQVKRLYGAKKAGHTGSLDPLATGMLPICFGEATKFCHYLLDADKCYEATGLLGIKTNTGDALGEIVQEIKNFSTSEVELNRILSQYRGCSQQMPSMFSALKHQGVPLYRYARKGIDVSREPREINVHKLELIHFDGKEFRIEVLCSKGTYIRNLVEDIGDDLGTGAHVIQLHRHYTAGFSGEKIYTLDELQAKTQEQLLDCLLPMERAVDYLPVTVLSPSEVIALRQGKVIQGKVPAASMGCVRLHDEAGCFIGLGQQVNGALVVKRLLTEQSVSTF